MLKTIITLASLNKLLDSEDSRYKNILLIAIWYLT